MRQLQRYLLAIALLLVLASCEHRPLSDPNNTHYLRVYLDEQIKNVTCDFYDATLERPVYTRPTVLRLAIFDPSSDKIVAERFLQNQGDDARGHYFDGHISLPAGKYNMLVYSFGSAISLVRNEYSFFDMEAYTNPVGGVYLQYLPSSRNEIDPSKIVNAPEHLFHASAQPLVVKNSMGLDTLYTADGDHFTAHSMVKSYYLQVKVKGFEWIRTAVSMMGGMAGSALMHGRDMIAEANPVHVFFAMRYTKKERARDSSSTSATLYTTFNTFGKLPDVQSVYTLNVELVRSDGTSQVEQIDITPMFDTPMVRDKQWILIDKEIVVERPEGASGGMSPGVESWNNVESDLQM